MIAPPAGRILVVEDDPATAETVELYLRDAGYEVDTAADGRAGLERAGSGQHDLVILDLMLPGIDGVELCRRLRRSSRVPVIMVTARTTEDDRVRGLQLGADDYVTKPFSPRELVARVQAVLRRADEGAPAGEILRFGDLCVDLARQRVEVDGRTSDLTGTETRLLRALVGAPGRVFSREELIERALGPDFQGYDRTVDAHVKNLRKKVEPDRSDPVYIRTVVGCGYRFDAGPEGPS